MTKSLNLAIMTTILHMRKKDSIEIQEPPIQELKKQRSCLKRSCITGCGSVFIFIVIFLLLLKIGSSTTTRELKSIPENFTKAIPIYDTENVDRVIFISGKNKGRLVEIAAFLPKLILSPILLTLDEYEVLPISPEDKKGAEGFTWNNFIKLMNEPMVDKRDSIEFEWYELPATPKFIYEYYKIELAKKDFQIKETEITSIKRQLNFHRDDLDGQLHISDDPDKEGTDYILLNLNLPIK